MPRAQSVLLSSNHPVDIGFVSLSQFHRLVSFLHKVFTTVCLLRYGLARQDRAGARVTGRSRAELSAWLSNQIQ